MYLATLFMVMILSAKSFLAFSNKICNARRQFYLKDKFEPVYEEKTVQLNHKNKKFNALSNSFFAQIGSNPKYTEDEDYHWFDGDGMIHGVFFNDSLITYQNKWIQTTRFQVEKKWKRKMYLYFGELKGMKGLYQIFKYSLMELFGFIPQAKGTANTALLNWKQRIFALHEGDMPYELDIDYEKFNISTKKRINFNSIYSTTAHPIIDKTRDLIYLYGYNNYDFLKGNFIFNTFDKNLNLLSQKNVSLINNGMTHDVGFTGHDIIIPDMPLKYDVNRIMREQLPLFFDKKNGKTRFGIFHVETKKEPRWFDFKENFFIFHFSRAFKNQNEYVVFACVMEDLFMEDFVDVENMHNEDHIIRGNIRLKELRLNIETNNTEIIENKYLQNLDLGFHYNLDFPISSKLDSKHVYCTIFDSALGYIKGYIKIDTSNFKFAKPHVFLFDENVYGNSEPQTVVIDNQEYLVSFTNDDENSYISLIDVIGKNVESLRIYTRIPPGFHSIFYKT